MNTLNFIKECGNIDDIRKKLFAINIKSYTTDNRIICFPSQHKKKFDNPVARECNGLLIERKEEKNCIISLPPRILNNRYNKKSISGNIKHYDIYKMYNGSIITIYWWDLEQKWCISSTRGYSVGDIKWNNNTKTYKEILDSLINLYYDDVDEFYNNLCKNKSYTIGFNHPEFHIFVEQRNKDGYIWFIHSYNRITGHVDCSNDFEFPGQKKLFSGVCYNKRSTENKESINIESLENICDNTLKYYTNESDVLYGYIFRSTNCEITRNQSDVMIESKLFKTIKHLIYNKHINKIVRENDYDKIDYVILNNYNDIGRFIALFPQYKSKYIIIKNELHSKVKAIQKIIPNLNESQDTDKHSIVYKYAMEINKIYNAEQDDMSDVIYQYITSKNNIVDAYYG